MQYMSITCAALHVAALLVVSVVLQLSLLGQASAEQVVAGAEQLWHWS
jgi:hypothetical protein